MNDPLNVIKLWMQTALIVCSVSLAPPVHAQLTTLPASVQEALNRYGLPASSLSVFVQDVASTKPLLVFDADKPRNPASTIKLITTFVGLEMLGPAYTWKTEAYSRGAVIDGRLYGDLIIKGYGDPFLVTEYLWKFLHGLRDRGMRHISGDLVIDNSYFGFTAEQLVPFGKDIYRSYNALADALLVNFQTIQFTFVPDRRAGNVTIIADPQPANLTIVNNLRLMNGACRGRQHEIKMAISNNDVGGTVEFGGHYPASCGEYAMNRVVLKPAAKADGLFRKLWTELGGKVDGQSRAGVTPEDAKLIYAMESRPLAELIRGMNKFSNNVMTRQLFLTLGAERFGPPGTYEKGRAAIMTWLETNGLDFAELVLDNGAGLSRTTQISAHSMGLFLLQAYKSPYMPEFVSSLPVSGVDGTLGRRFKGEPLAGRLRLKTGSLNNVAAIAGYVLSRTGRTLVVVSLQNYPRLDRWVGIEIQNTVLQWAFDR